MSRVSSVAMALLLAASPAFAEVSPPAVEPRSYLSPTDELEPAPRVPPVTQPKPMPRTRMGQPVEAAPAERAAPPPATKPEHAAPAQRRVSTPRRATAPHRAARRYTTPPARRIARMPAAPDTSLSTIFTQPRYDAHAPLKTLAPQSGPAAVAPPPRRAMTYNYAPVPPTLAPGRPDEAPCPTRSPTSLGALFACTR